MEEAKEQGKSSLGAIAEGIVSAFQGGGEEKKEKEKPRLSLITAELLPRIRRGFTGEEEKHDPVSLGWKADVRSRKDREEVLR